MQSVETIITKGQCAPPEILCAPLPFFDSTDLESVRRAFQGAASCPLQQTWLDEEEIGFSPGTVRTGWRGDSLLIFAELTDIDIFNDATKLNQRVWELGDAFEIFLRAEKKENYVELHVTPNNQRLQLHYPDGTSAEKVRKNGGLEIFLIWDEAFHSKTWVEDGMWLVYAEIPASLVCNPNEPIENTRWRFSFGRYDYARGVEEPVVSSSSRHAKPDFHRQHEWGVMTFKKFDSDSKPMTKRTLLILAAGMGSRYGGLKQIDSVGPDGETIIDYSVYDAMRAGFNQLVFVIRRDIEKIFRETIGSRFEKRIAVQYVFQESNSLPPGMAVSSQRKKPWGTGHAILTAADAIHEPFGVINADDFYGAQSFQLLAAHLQPGNPNFAMVGFVLRNTLSEFGTVSRGVCQLTDDHLENVREIVGIEKFGAVARYKNGTGEFHALTGGEIVSMNMWGFNPTIFNPLREQFMEFLKSRGSDEKAEFYIPSVVNGLIQSRTNRVKVLQTRSSWFGVTYLEDRPFVAEGIRQLIRKGEYPERLWI